MALSMKDLIVEAGSPHRRVQLMHAVAQAMLPANDRFEQPLE